MTFFSLDTSARKAFFTLIKNGRIKKHLVLLGDATLSSNIHPLFQEFLSPDERSHLRGIIVGLGPGSFTGTRVGIVLAKTLAYSLKIPIWGVPSLAFVTKSAEEISVLDAKKRGIYCYQENKVSLLPPNNLQSLDNCQVFSVNSAPLEDKLPKTTISERDPNPLFAAKPYLSATSRFSPEEAASLEAIYF